MFKDIVYQFSLSDVLLNSIFDGDFTLEEILKYGDFGLGTIDGLDGELIIFEGKPYSANAKGEIIPISTKIKSPIAIITTIDKPFIKEVYNLNSKKTLSIIDTLLQTDNIIYAIKIDGEFSRINLRSLDKQAKPYKPILDIELNYYGFEYIKGSVIGFKCPPFMKGLNVPGYHFHFIDEKLEKGGHVLDFEMTKGVISIDVKHKFQLFLPSNPDFFKLDLENDLNDVLLKIESNC